MSRLQAKQLLKRSRLVRALHEAATGHNARIIEGLPGYVPFSAGTGKELARLTLESVNQTGDNLIRYAESFVGARTARMMRAESFADEWGPESHEELAAAFDRHGSDKSSAHNYHLIYGPILSDLGNVTALLEIGMGTSDTTLISNMGSSGQPGASLRAFADFLPAAAIFGADVDRNILFRTDRITTFWVDQTDFSTVETLMDGLPAGLDLVIDDGLHSPNANLAVAHLARRQLRSGGWLVIEDISPSALALWRGISMLLELDFCTTLVEARGGFVLAARRH